MIERWSSVLRPKAISVYPINMVQAGPRTLTGRQQLGAPDAGYWGLAGDFQIFTRDQVLEWRGLVAAFGGGLNSVIMGVYDDRQTPTEDGVVMVGGITHSDGTTFSDGAGYSQSTVQIELATDLELRATTARFRVIEAGPLRRGMYFSIEDRLSIITRPPTEAGAGLYDVEFWPPARADWPAGQRVEMARPTGTWRLADPKSGAAKLSGLYYGEPSIEFVESFEGL